MGHTATSPSIKDSSERGRLSPAYVILILPVLGFLALLWVASHRIAKPDISIFQAIDEGNYGAVQAHLLTGTSVNSVNQNGHTPLFEAISEKKPQIVQLLLDNGASVQAENHTFVTPLYEAAGQGNLDLVQQLLNKGAKADEIYVNGATALHAAAAAHNLDIVKLLLDRGAPVNAVADHDGGTPLCNAVISDNISITELLLSRGADVSLKGPLGRTPLHFAANSGDLRMVQLLLDHGASPDALDKIDVIPLTCSLEKGDNRISHLLLPKTKDVSVVQATNDYNLLHYAVFGRCDVGIVKELVRRGVDPSARNSEGDTPLMMAYDQNSTDLVNVLSSAGARIPLSYLIRHALYPPPPKTGVGGFTGVE